MSLRESFPVVRVVLVVVLALGGWWGYHHFFAAPPVAEAPVASGGGGFGIPVEIAKAEAQTLEETAQSVGTLVSEDGVIVRPELAGVVAKILFEDGQDVEAGQPLIQLEDSVYRAQLAEAEAQLSLAKRTNSRASELAGRGAGTKQAADEAAAQLEVATAAVHLAKATLAKMLVAAPFAGTVGIRQVSLGDYVSPGQALVSLQSLDNMRLDFRVPETLLARVAVGQKVSLRIQTWPGQTFDGVVSAIDPLVSASDHSLALRAHIPNPDKVLRPGLFATVTLSLGEKPGAVFVPDTAIAPMGNQQFVFRVENGLATLTPVTLGERQPGRVVVSSGLKAGDEIVTAGQVKLMMMGGAQHPMPVTAVNASAAPSPKAEQ